ncbi:XrtA/PEP-CTERM system TPR-repeat protein PrsT [Psychrosphaera aestuarii]|uniref:XrtA/PEP-CTERM system TPR-repeat protein PrsT n=1 Tax=Psychrosphaera aestuarii TaxID=1266052 RepID=UPI001B3322A6|nr:XrtA/PEP-CTERM system TPR-repeat protein PrsT [Psychrosphaera aestuarii]
MLKRLLFPVVVIFSLSFSNISFSANNYYEQAVQAFNEGNYEASFIYLKNALEQQPRNLPAKILMGKIYLHKGYFDEAITEFEEALVYKADINLIVADYASALNFAKQYKKVLSFSDGYNLNLQSQYELLLNKGIAYQNLDLTELTKQTYEKAIQHAKADIRAFNSYAAFLLAKGEVSEAERLVKKSLEKTPYDHRTLHLLGTVQIEKGDIDAAIESFENALLDVEEDPVVLRSLVRAYIKADRLKDAKNLIDNILEMTPNDPHMMLLSSWLLSIDKKDAESAQMLEALSNATSLIPEDVFNEDPSLIFVGALSAYLQGNLEQASKDLTRYLAVRAGDTNAIAMLSDVYIKLGKEQEAELLLERYESSVIKNKDLAIRLVDLYNKNGKRFDAERLLSKLQSEYPNEIDILLRQVNLLNKAGRSMEAKRLIESIESKNDTTTSRLALAKGLMYLQSGDISNASLIAEQLLQAQPENLELLNFKVAVLIKQNQAEKAQAIAEQIIEQKSEFFEARFNLATALKMQNKVTQAQSILIELFELRPENNDVKYMLSETYAINKQFDKAIPLLETITLGVTGQRSKELLYDIYYQLGEFTQANRIIKDLTNTNLYNVEYLFKYVQTLKKLNRFTEAKQQLGILYGLAENNGRLLFDIAVSQRGIDDIEGASTTLSRLTKLLPNNLRVKLEVIRLSMARGDIDSAKQQAIALTKSHKNEPNILLLLGDIELLLKNKINAFDYYWRAFEVDNKFNMALMNLYQLAKDGINSARLTTKLKALAEEYDNELWRKKLLADHYTNLGDFSSALPIYLNLLNNKIYQQDPYLLNNLANIYLDENLDKAYEYAIKAYKINDANSAIADTLGWIYFKLNRNDEALQTLRTAFAMDSSNPTVRYHLANVLIKLNRKTEAKNELEFAIKNAKSHVWLNEAKVLLEQLR